MAQTQADQRPPTRQTFSLSRWARREIGVIAIIGLALIYALNAWTPSHYGEALRLLGVENTGLVAGASHGVRSDEWAVSTPYVQIAVANDLGPRNEASPYREPLKPYSALPSKDWSMLFKPDFWGFLFLDPAHAFALHYAFLAASMLIGFALLLRQFGCGPGFAIAVSALLFFSQLAQTWWTSHGATFAFAPWVLAAYLWRAPWFVRLPALTYAVAVWLISFLYPPYIIAAASAFAILLVAFRRDALRPGVLLPAVLAAAVGGGLAWLYFSDLIVVMRETVYPGHRVAEGGVVPKAWVAANLFPYLTTYRFEPMARWVTNLCEISVVGSFLPLAFAVFTDHRTLLTWARAHRWTVVIWLTGLGLMVAWMILPIPGRLAPIWNLVPPTRMQWGLGLLFTLGLAIIASQVRWVASFWRAGIFLLLVVAGWGLSKVALSDPPVRVAGFDLIILPVFAALLLVAAAIRRPGPTRAVVMLAMVITSALTFGRFNPVQSAVPIFERQKSPTIDVFEAYAAANPHRWVIVPGVYGAVLNAAGIPAINHTLMRPEMGFFRRAFPDLDATELNQVFNRYAHISPAPSWRPTVLQADLVGLPPDRFAIPEDVEIVSGPSAPGPPAGALDQVALTPLGPGLWGATAMGWSPWSGVSRGQRLRVALSDRVKGRIVRASAFRMPRPDVAAGRSDPTLFAAGFWVRMEIQSDRPLTTLSPTDLVLESVDPRLGVRPVKGAGLAQASSPGA